jgi:type IV pilus assembly protein PilY1
MITTTSSRALRAGLTAAMALVVASLGRELPAADINYVDLIPTPPDLTASVDPNIVVTFDDSGSMQSNFMGDSRPFDGSAWGAPYACAGVIGGDSLLAGHAMNGVYYNPNILYVPPIKADGSRFPDADASLAAVWGDGIAINRPLGAVGVGSAGYNNNPISGGGASDNFRTIINGAKVGSTDHRWTCGYGSYPLAFAGGEVVNNGGPYYYRLKAGISIPIDLFGNPTAAGRTTLYTAGNWEAVRVPNANATIEGQTVNQWQNFANWYAYYRTRNLMTRTALSRVFGGLGGNVRVAWQNINNGTYALPAAAIITNLLDKAGVSCSGTSPSTTFGTGAQPDCYRSAFFNWVFQTGAGGTTPDRAATIRAGNFFKRGSSAITNLLNPYWQLPGNGLTTGRELSCRQNFHMLVTDGYWNEGDPALPSPYQDSQTGVTLPMPDGTPFAVGGANTQTRIFWDVVGTKYASSLANIAFNYWASDLRPDLTNNVPPFVPDKTVGVTGSAAASVNPPLSNLEIYFNPANDPAKWQHVVQFMVTLGVSGKLIYSPDADCANLSSDTCNLRKGLPNSTGVAGWPRPINNTPEAIDDTWHAAVNSRGSFFSAGDPSALVSHLTDIITSILQRRGSSTALAATLPLLTAGTDGFLAGYDTGDWSGTVTKNGLDPATGDIIGPPAEWDAACLLTGGACPGAPSSGGQPARNPNSRAIYTSNGVPGSTKTFLWGSLNTYQQARLNINPATLQLNLVPPTWTADAYGPQRVDYLRGVRTNEAAGTPQFRQRSSVVGAVIHGQPVYVSSPTRGYRDIFPVGSPEAAAPRSYATFQNINRNRRPVVYVGANDGMLHAFDALTGHEDWAYVPNMLFGNFGLDKATKFGSGLTVTVDDSPLNSEVFIRGAWTNVLLGSMRLGGRGIYALDVTNPNASTPLALWEFSNVPPDGSAPTSAGDCAVGSNYCSSLGYTYYSVNTARLHNGKWVALVASGYFPIDTLDPASKDPKGTQASLLVIDLETGTLIRELKTANNRQGINVTNSAFGLSTPITYDFAADQIDDIAVAGDLAGNLWRFDLSDPTPSNWTIDLMFRTYGNSDLATAIGEQPITVNPQAMVDTTTRKPIFIFGTGKYLGASDRTSSIPTQAYYGIRDYGNGSTTVPANVYPIKVSELTTQTMTEDVDGVRKIIVDPAGIPTTKRGWRIKMNIASGGPNGNGEAGERSIEGAFPLYSTNRVLLKSIIPKSSDPCDPGNRFAIMVVDAATGGPVLSGGSRVDATIVGGAFSAPSPIGNPIALVGGGGFVLPGLDDLLIPQRVKDVLSPPSDTNPNSVMTDDVWHRGAWRELLNVQ